LVEAVRRGASDIHIIPKGNRISEIHMRIDGTLRLWHVQDGVRPESLAAVVKDRTKNVDRFEREKSQDGFIQRKVNSYNIRYRVSVIPIVGKEFSQKLESIVIRILDDRKVITDLDKLGFGGNAKDFFIKAISKPQGMIIVTGPTGSGKSTTLIAALAYIMRPEINVLTVEDPVEYIINGARQIKISHKNNFESALRAILRHDPDVVMVGEIRDKETAETGIKLANTGHLTFSTLHTNDAPSAVSRLYKMGVETFLIAYAINIIIAQRLVRRLCEYCKKPIRSLDPIVPKSLGFTDEEIKKTVFYEAVGCNKCHNGYKGRAAIHETLYFSKEIRKLIFETGSDINEEAIKEVMAREGMHTLRAAGRERIKQGLTTLNEVAAITTED
ncbi:MAG: GspE/PulE family protein, partial [Calditrichia bacterium]